MYLLIIEICIDLYVSNMYSSYFSLEVLLYLIDLSLLICFLVNPCISVFKHILTLVSSFRLCGALLAIRVLAR